MARSGATAAAAPAATAATAGTATSSRPTAPPRRKLFISSATPAMAAFITPRLIVKSETAALAAIAPTPRTDIATLRTKTAADAAATWAVRMATAADWAQTAALTAMTAAW